MVREARGREGFPVVLEAAHREEGGEEAASFPVRRARDETVGSRFKVELEGDIAGSSTEGRLTMAGEEECVTGGEGARTKDPLEMRLSRRIARSGVASRREAER